MLAALSAKMPTVQYTMHGLEYKVPDQPLGPRMARFKTQVATRKWYFRTTASVPELAYDAARVKYLMAARDPAMGDWHGFVILEAYHKAAEIPGLLGVAADDKFCCTYNQPGDKFSYEALRASNSCYIASKHPEVFSPAMRYLKGHWVYDTVYPRRIMLG